MKITIPNEPECKHVWRPYTVHKAKCRKCKHARPWTDIVAEYKGIVAEYRIRERVSMQTIRGQGRMLNSVTRALVKGLGILRGR
jgi:hypothetical protein